MKNSIKFVVAIIIGALIFPIFQMFVPSDDEYESKYKAIQIEYDKLHGEIQRIQQERDSLLHYKNSIVFLKDSLISENKKLDSLWNKKSKDYEKIHRDIISGDSNTIIRILSEH